MIDPTKGTPWHHPYYSEEDEGEDDPWVEKSSLPYKEGEDEDSEFDREYIWNPPKFDQYGKPLRKASNDEQNEREDDFLEKTFFWG